MRMKDVVLFAEAKSAQLAYFFIIMMNAAIS